MPLTSLVVNPLTSLRYESPRTPTEVKFNHILLFSLAGGLVILCSLFNFLMLFVTRIYTRKKELALRQICGSSYKGLLALFSIEFLILFFTSLLIGMVLIELVYPFFKELGYNLTKVSCEREAQLFLLEGLAIRSKGILLCPVQPFTTAQIFTFSSLSTISSSLPIGLSLPNNFLASASVIAHSLLST